jgi:hypothetical protein
MDRESFLRERRALCGQLELDREQVDAWIRQARSPSMVKWGLKWLVRYGMMSVAAKTPFSLTRFLFK